MVDRVAGDADVGLAVVRQHRVAAIGVAGAAREIAAGHIDLDPAAGAESVVDVAESDGQRLDPSGRQRLRPGRRVAVHRAHHPVHQQHGAPVRVTSISLATKSVSGQSDCDMQSDADLAGDRQIRVKRLAAIDQAVIGQRLSRALVARAGVDQHVAPAEGRDRVARIVAIAARPRRPAIGAEAAVAAQIEPLRR